VFDGLINLTSKTILYFN